MGDVIGYGVAEEIRDGVWELCAEIVRDTESDAQIDLDCEAEEAADAGRGAHLAVVEMSVLDGFEVTVEAAGAVSDG